MTRLCAPAIVFALWCALGLAPVRAQDPPAATAPPAGAGAGKLQAGKPPATRLGVGEAAPDGKAAFNRYVTLDPLLIPIIRHNDVHKIVTLVITVELKDADERLDVEGKMPLLRDAYLSDLTRLFQFGLYDHRSVDLLLVKRRLLAVSQKVLGRGVVDAVLIMDAMERAV